MSGRSYGTRFSLAYGQLNREKIFTFSSPVKDSEIRYLYYSTGHKISGRGSKLSPPGVTFLPGSCPHDLRIFVRRSVFMSGVWRHQISTPPGVSTTRPGGRVSQKIDAFGETTWRSCRARVDESTKFRDVAFQPTGRSFEKQGPCDFTRRRVAAGIENRQMGPTRAHFL